MTATTPTILSRIWKPWYLYRPGQLVRRAARQIRRPRSPYQVIPLPWGCSIEVDIRETIGRSLWTTGVYDLSVVEVLTRLANPQKLALDVGANIGAMVGAMAARSAEVWAFEPNAVVGQRLANNVERIRRAADFAPCRIFDIALGDFDGEGRFELPDGSDENHGLGRITAGACGVPVRIARLDSLLEGREVGLMKVDVEGHELEVFRGAGDSLAAGRIAHIVFEEHAGPESETCRYLMQQGYSIFEVAWRLNGPVVAAPGSGVQRDYEAPNYLATREPEFALAACRPRGWHCFRRRRPGQLG